MASLPSPDLEPGTQIAGFRVDRLIGRGSHATVYEATQSALGRRVALKVMHDRGMAERVRRLRWPEHPGAVSLYGVGDSEHGPWLAMRLVSGGTLATTRAPLDQVADALRAAHADGIVHGDVSARNVLIENGRAYLSDFALTAAPDATPEQDTAALARLARERGPRRSTRPVLALAAVALLVVAVLVAVAATGDDDDGGAAAAAPTAPEGTRSVGSGLAAGGVESVDCMGDPPDGSSRTCTISQRELDGRAVVVPAAGTVTSWAVRGARGTLALQVLRGDDLNLVQVGKSGDEEVPDDGAHLFRTDIPVEAGDRIALDVAPASAVGIRRSGPPATIDRWFGPLLEPARPPESPAGSGLDHELLLRVDVTASGGGG